MDFLAYQTDADTGTSAMLRRIAEADKAAVKDCIDAYGNLVWALARKYTDSLEEAEIAAQEVFLDVWRYAGHCDPTKFDEAVFIFLIARRRLIKRLL